MVFPMRKRSSRVRASSAEIQKGSGKKKQTKQSSSSAHFVPARQEKKLDQKSPTNAKTKNARESTASAPKVNQMRRTSKPARRESNTSASKTNQMKPSTKENQAIPSYEPMPLSLPRESSQYRRRAKSDSSVASSSVKKALGLRPNRGSQKLMNSHQRNSHDDRTFLTFNTLPDRLKYQQELAERENASRPSLLATTSEHIVNQSQALGKSVKEGSENFGTSVSTCFQAVDESIRKGSENFGNAVSASFQSGLVAIEGACTAAQTRMSASSPEGLNRADTMDEFLDRVEVQSSGTYTAAPQVPVAQSKSDGFGSHHQYSSSSYGTPRSDPTPLASNYHYHSGGSNVYSHHSNVHSHHSNVHDSTRATSIRSSKTPNTYDWENLDDESLVVRPSVVPHPNKLQIGRQLIDYDDLTRAYNDAQIDLEDPGCCSTDMCQCFQWDEDDHTMYTYPSAAREAPPPGGSDSLAPSHRYGFDSPSTIQEVDETNPSFDNTYQGTYDTRDEASSAGDGHVHWRY